jgi:hypothetical protein
MISLSREKHPMACKTKPSKPAKKAAPKPKEKKK